MANYVERNGKIYARKVYRDSKGKKKQIWRVAESRSDAKQIHTFCRRCSNRQPIS